MIPIKKKAAHDYKGVKPGQVWEHKKSHGKFKVIKCVTQARCNVQSKILLGNFPEMSVSSQEDLEDFLKKYRMAPNVIISHQVDIEILDNRVVIEELFGAYFG